MAVALYARVSTVRQAEKNLSIPDQLRQMREWCASRGYSIGHEYIEAGESATDDRRPEFQIMMSEATISPSPFEAIIVHSLSRFYRDSLEFGLHERTLNRSNVRLISITQETSNDPAGEMARKIFSVFDEYSSKENGKHTLRAMKENARQGFWNGAPAPFGYRIIEVEVVGNNGKRKSKIAIDPVESILVKRIFDLYLYGGTKGSMGAKDIATHLNETGQTLRGTLWSRARVHEVLSNEIYIGQYYFNKKNNKTKLLKPESEWVPVPVDPMIDKAIFEATKARKQSRSFDVVPPRVVTTKTLLTGLAKCGLCGSSMTLMTGKGGKYRYYKCATRINKGARLCTNPAVPMEKLDQLVLSNLASQVFSESRVKSMLAELKRQIKDGQEADGAEIKVLQKELDLLQTKSSRLMEAVENNLIPMDEVLQKRSHQISARRQEVLLEMAGYKRKQSIPAVKPNQVGLFCNALRSKLLDRDSGFGKDYLRHLVSEIRVTAKEAQISGSKAELARAVGFSKSSAPLMVPTSVNGWLLDLGSNQGPTD
ncbi:recombinase family protein [Polynucleobacter sp. UB-Tiil-W10]|uniref:recombinase family protein n=1 Tax=Polynucleobacter sp. UB-Tiil-W10 TaxID=1855648 RepID=UPI00351D4A75